MNERWLHLGEVYGLALGVRGRVALFQLSHHLHQVTSLSGSLRLNLDLPPPPPPLARQGQSVLLQHQGKLNCICLRAGVTVLGATSTDQDSAALGLSF